MGAGGVGKIGWLREWANVLGGDVPWADCEGFDKLSDWPIGVVGQDSIEWDAWDWWGEESGNESDGDTGKEI